MSVMFRTECNYGSKYFEDISAAFRHFYKCVANRDSVEIWIVGNKVQTLLDSVYFS